MARTIKERVTQALHKRQLPLPDAEGAPVGEGAAMGNNLSKTQAAFLQETNGSNGSIINAVAGAGMTAFKPFIPSKMQAAFFGEMHRGKGSIILEAVAGSGKSTTIRRCLPVLPPRAHVLILAFSTLIAADMRDGIAALAEELGMTFPNVSARTFHSLGLSAVAKRLGKPARDVESDKNKLRKLFKDMMFDLKGSDPDEQERLTTLYGSFVVKLVSLAKGVGIGVLEPDDFPSWEAIVAHHDLTMDSEEANEETAIRLAHKLLKRSNEAAKKGWIDFDDHLYLPLLWKLTLWQHDYVFVDEAQDTNPVRRALAKKALKWGGRLIAVGDAHQSIFGFTGASTDALDLIQREFSAKRMPLTVSYRCPKAAEPLVKPLVPYFSVAESADQGAVLTMGPNDGVARLGDRDAVLCRNTAPLVDLAFALIAQGRGCTVLGRDIGESLIDLIEKQRTTGIDRLLAKLDEYQQTEIQKYMVKGEEEKADALTDRIACVRVICGKLEGADKTVPGLIAKIEGMFSEGKNGLLTLCTAHKAKGKEWKRVGILAPELMPSKFARQEWQQQQEQNLIYVAYTRFQEELIFLNGEDDPTRNTGERS